MQLGNLGRLSGVVIVHRNSNLHRLEGAKLQTSTDDKVWTDVHTFTGIKSAEQRIELSGKVIDAGYVRVVSEVAADNYLHFHRFQVFGKKQN